MEKVDHSSMRKLKTYRTKSGHHPRDIKISLRRIIVFSMIAVVFLAVIGFWTHHAVKTSLGEIYSTYLQSLLDADIDNTPNPTSIERQEVVDGKLILQGAEDGYDKMHNGLGWTMAISEESGQVVLTASGEQVAFVIFSASIPM